MNMACRARKILAGQNSYMQSGRPLQPALHYIDCNASGPGVSVGTFARWRKVPLKQQLTDLVEVQMRKYVLETKMGEARSNPHN